MEVAAAVNLAQHAATNADVANDRGVDGNDLGRLWVDPGDGAGMGQPVCTVAARSIMRVGLQLEFFDQAPVANFAPEPGNLVSAEYVVDKTGLLLSLFLLFRDDGNL